MISLLITGRRWFNRRCGNTYYSAVAYIDGKPVASIDYDYGYGNQYEWGMFGKLEAMGLLPSPREQYPSIKEAPFRYCERLGISYSTNVTDVMRKKDL